MSKKKIVQWEFEDSKYGKLVIKASGKNSIEINIVGFIATKTFSDWAGFIAWQKDSITEVLSDA